MAKKRAIPEPDLAERTPSEVSADLAAAPVPDSADWCPPAGYLVSDERTFRIRVEGVLFEHVSEAPDGRWVYAPV